MSNHVGDREIVAKEKIFEAEGSEEDQAAGGESRLASALYQQRVARANGDDTANKRIHRANKRQQQRK